MESSFRISGYGALVLQSGQPPWLDVPLLYGGSAWFSENELGVFIVQEWRARHYGIRYLMYHFKTQVNLMQFCRRGGLHLRLMLNGRLTHRIRQAGRIHLKEKQFAVVYGRGMDLQSRVAAGSTYSCLDLFVSPEFLDGLSAQFPQLRDIPEGESFRLLSKPARAGRDVFILIDSMIGVPFTRSAGQVFLEEHVDLLLQLLLEQALGPGMGMLEETFTEAEEAAVREAKAIIESNYRLHVTIEELARRVGLNESRLKLGFRVIYGMGIFDCLIEARMQAAYDMVVNSREPIKSIAITVGYRQLSSFSNAFKRYFGVGPATLRHGK